MRIISLALSTSLMLAAITLSLLAEPTQEPQKKVTWVYPTSNETSENGPFLSTKADTPSCSTSPVLVQCAPVKLGK